MGELVAWLEARLTDDETTARKLADTIGADWWVDGPAENSGRWWIYDLGVKFGSKYEADFIARHDPARVLAEVAAKRAILAALADAEAAVGEAPQEAKAFCSAHADGLRVALRALALVYADCDGYDERWAL